MAAAAGTLAIGLYGPVSAQTIAADTSLKPGQWLWYPERSLYGPVTVIVSLSDQLAFVYRNGVHIGVTTISSGRSGFDTPTGVFTVFQKEKLHLSKKYNNAPMPDSQFFFGGAALHAGGLPGYPSSHGCVHLPTGFAAQLFDITHNGTPVIVTNERSGIGGLSHAGLVLSETDLKQIEKLTGHVAGKKLPVNKAGKKEASFSILVSEADATFYGMKNGEIIIQSSIGIANPNRSLGSHVFILQGFDSDRKTFDWLAVGMGTGHEDSVQQQRELAATSRLTIPPDTYAMIAENLHPGSAFMVTDLPAHPDTRTGTDFVIMRDRRS
ncbi:MAG: L,D-transpeptidase family protein [Hyphomicrobiales bacterium]|nr:L,D-transpeptidase family protein [Hyphomicrobiales bacterium]